MRKKNIFVIATSVILATALSGCSSGRNTSPKYPMITYKNSSLSIDPFNREIQIKDCYVLDEGHSYDEVETENGYDIVFHFVEVGE